MKALAAGTNDVMLSVGGEITDGDADATAADSTINVTASSLDVQGKQNLTDLETAVSSLTLDSKNSSITNSVSGTLTLNDSTLAGQLDLITDQSLVVGTVSAIDQVVNLTATAGSINATSLSAATLNGSSQTGIAVSTAVDQVTLVTSGIGDISLTDADDVILTSVSTADGAISVTSSTGSIVATDVASVTNSDDNDISLISLAGNISIASANAQTSGDVVLTAGSGKITLSLIHI